MYVSLFFKLFALKDVTMVENAYFQINAVVQKDGQNIIADKVRMYLIIFVVVDDATCSVATYSY